jgi:hypothetical protein
MLLSNSREDHQAGALTVDDGLARGNGIGD